MKGLIYFGYAIAIVGVGFAVADTMKGLFKAWRESDPALGHVCSSVCEMCLCEKQAAHYGREFEDGEEND